MPPESTLKASPSFGSHVLSFASGSLVSKVFGYARDAAMVAFFGAGWLSDAYYAAFRIVSLFRRTVGEGSVNAAFVPALASERNAGRGPEFFAAAWTLALGASALLCLAAFLFRRELVLLTARGFADDPALLGLTVLLTAVLLPHVVLVAASALLQGVLNAERRFFLPQAAAASFSAAVLAYLGLAASPLGADFTMEQKVIGLAAAASASGLLQCAILLPAAARAGYLPRLSNPLSNPAAIRLLAISLPALLAAAQDQLALLVNAFFASFMEPGSITAIYNAARLTQFPVSLFAAASAAVALPSLSGGLLQRDPDKFRSTLDSAFRLTAVISFPATAGLIALSLPVTRALFEHGRFTPEMSALTAAVLACLAAGLAGYAFNKLAASVFYALGDLVTPLWVVGLQVALNAALCFALAPSMGAPGLTLATSVSSLATGAGFALLLARRVPGAFSPGLGGFIARTLAAASVMGLACAGGARLMSGLHPLLNAALLVPAGVWLYFLMLRAMGEGGARELLGLSRGEKA